MQPKETDSGAGTGVSREEKAGSLKPLPSKRKGEDLEPGTGCQELAAVQGNLLVRYTLPQPRAWVSETLGWDPQAGRQVLRHGSCRLRSGEGMGPDKRDPQGCGCGSESTPALRPAVFQLPQLSAREDTGHSPPWPGQHNSSSSLCRAAG